MFRTTSSTLFAAGLLLAGCGQAPDRAVTLTPAASGVGHQTVAHATADSAQLATRMAALEAAVERLQANAGTPAAAASATWTPSARAQHGSVARTWVEPPSAELPLAARAAQVQGAFLAESIDARWAQSAEAGIRSALRDVGPPGLNAQVDCRSGSCRVVVAAMASDGDAWLQQLTMRVASSFSTVRVFGADGANGTVLYLST